MSESVFIAHALCMTAAIGFFIPIGILSSMYKNKYKNWYYVHAISQSSAITLASTGFVLGINTAEDGSFITAHSIIGTTVMALIWFQCINAAVRPHPSPNPTQIRRVWEITHHISGRIILILGFINMGFGIVLAHDNEYINDTMSIIMMTELFTFGIIIGILLTFPMIEKIKCKKNVESITMSI